MLGVTAVSKALLETSPCLFGPIELQQLVTCHKIKLVLSSAAGQMFGQAAEEP